MKLKVATIQSGAYTANDTYESYLSKQCDLLRDVVAAHAPYLVGFQE